MRDGIGTEAAGAGARGNEAVRSDDGVRAAFPPDDDDDDDDRGAERKDDFAALFQGCGGLAKPEHAEGYDRKDANVTNAATTAGRARSGAGERRRVMVRARRSKT
mmetsp:Transcript_39813/g.81268  ORF Transcript_39813/g.81268 Transcript_39813/m.81268 type:complete len:105 (+) Transcript_39813:893-1207(+)